LSKNIAATGALECVDAMIAEAKKDFRIYPQRTAPALELLSTSRVLLIKNVNARTVLDNLFLDYVRFKKCCGFFIKQSIYDQGYMIMPMVIGVVLRKTRDKIYADAGHSDLKLNDEIILETEHGVEDGIVREKEKVIQESKYPIGKVLRKITERDKKRLAENERKNLRAKNIVLQKVAKCKLDMKLICVQYIFDRSKLFVYYVSETRIDFRELVKDLGHVLRTRIQMVQVGVRDESKIVGGIGICGYVLCCRTFLKDFNSVTIDMAKEQDLSLSTAKLSGHCNRLMCCIAYENDVYRAVKKRLPQIGTTVLTPEGRAKIAAIDCIREKVTVDFGDKSFKAFTVKQINERNKKESK